MCLLLLVNIKGHLWRKGVEKLFQKEKKSCFLPKISFVPEDVGCKIFVERPLSSMFSNSIIILICSNRNVIIFHQGLLLFLQGDLYALCTLSYSSRGVGNLFEKSKTLPIPSFENDDYMNLSFFVTNHYPHPLPPKQCLMVWK